MNESDDLERPSKLLNPVVTLDGDSWIALHGIDLQSGIVGCGDTKEEALLDFDKSFYLAHTI